MWIAPLLVLDGLDMIHLPLLEEVFRDVSERVGDWGVRYRGLSLAEGNLLSHAGAAPVKSGAGRGAAPRDSEGGAPRRLSLTVGVEADWSFLETALETLDERRPSVLASMQRLGQIGLGLAVWSGPPPQEDADTGGDAVPVEAPLSSEAPSPPETAPAVLGQAALRELARPQVEAEEPGGDTDAAESGPELADAQGDRAVARAPAEASGRLIDPERLVAEEWNSELSIYELVYRGKAHRARRVARMSLSRR